MIHENFNLFFATGSKQYLEFLLTMNVKHVLISYAYPEPWIMKGMMKRNNINLLCDSGAFTAWNLCQRKKMAGDPNWEKHKIVKEEYLEFMNEHKDIIWEAVNLDVIPGSQGQAPTTEEVIQAANEGWENYQWFKSKGWDTIHVYHEGEPFWVLDRMLKECRYIGVSPCNDSHEDKKMDWLDFAFRHIIEFDYKDNPNVERGKIIKTHGFGVTAKNLVHRYPWFSCDSSSYSLTAAMGSVLTPWGRVYISDQNQGDPDHLCRKPQEIQDHIEKYLYQQIGYGLKSMMDNKNMIDNACPGCGSVIQTSEKNQAYKTRNFANISYYMNLEKERQTNGPTLAFMNQKTLF